MTTDHPRHRKPPLVVVVGPTASGKTALAIELAEEFHGEIVSADSRQVYRGMDIGTAKASPEELSRVPHHLVDITKPTERLTLAEYKKYADRAIQHIQDRGLLPFLVGGTGLYVRAVVDNLAIPAVPPQPELRAELEKLDLETLGKRLKAVDPASYETVDQKNPRRLIRAIEVSETEGVSFEHLKGSAAPKNDTLMLGLKTDPVTLEIRVRRRVDDWLQRGLLDEIRRLHDEDGVSWDRLHDFGLHYRTFAEHLNGKLGFDEAKERAVKDNIRYAKRQLTWFKQDQRIRWISDEDHAGVLVSDWLIERASRGVRGAAVAGKR
ncbi:MAG: tRNA (adenosine(37)-N6)-dimethylallyltransferase MiaA [bacterium]|nr:tRNA (adenosine(37)-N6)-dimethylallyltransferase MiaA [bacterium]MDZ4247656.1 tRNA (adenosine(37)-N6)-dimethylallyltransferase MiaA [Patescibacteria group bacterium]